MSQRRRIEVEFTGNSRGFEAALNRINAGLTRTSTGVRSHTRDLNMMERQIMAIGTTARYALAGQLVFGITGAVQRLGQFNAALGEIASLAGTVNNQGQFSSIGSQIGEIGDEAIRVSNRVGLAADDIQQYMSRFYSSFDPPGGARGRMRQMREFVNEMAMLQAMMGREAGDPQALSAGIAGMVRGVDPSQRNIGANTRRIADIIAYVTHRSPVITGTDISRDIGRLSSAQVAMGMSPEEVFAVYGLASASGGSGAVIGRGVAQLLSDEILRPQTEDQIRAFQMAGLPTDPGALRNYQYGGRTGGIAVLTRMMEAVAPGMQGKNPELARILGNEGTSDAAAIGAAGRLKGMNITLGSQLFGQQESFRQFLNLLANGGPTALENFIDATNKAQRAGLARQRQEEALKHRTLVRFDEARRNLGLSMVRGIEWPLENLLARPTIGLSNLMNDNPTGTQVAMGVGGGLLAMRALQRISGRTGGRFARGLGRITGTMREGAGAALQAEAAPNILAGGATDGSRGNPYWVVIHPWSWSVGSPGGLSQPIPPVIPAPLRKAGRFGKWSARAGVLSLLTLPFLADDAAGWLNDKVGGPQRKIPPGHPLLAQYSSWQKGHGLSMNRERSPAVQDVISAFVGGQIGADRAENLLRALGSQRGRGVNDVQVNGKGAMDVTVRLVDAQGRVIATQEQAGVPVKWFGDTGFPMRQGKPGSAKGGR